MNSREPDEERELDRRLRESALAQRALRQRAEKLLGSGLTDALADELSKQDVLELVHELQVHQIELEMQNEELRQAQGELALSAERYSDLYDFAPVGYLSIGPEGQIIRANLTAGALLGAQREDLVGQFLARFVAPEHRSLLHALRLRLKSPELTESAEWLLQPMEGEAFWARLEIVTREEPVKHILLWQVAISNIDAQKRAELMLQRLNEELEDQVARRTEQLTLSNRHLLEEISLRREAEAELREHEEQLERRVEERTRQLGALLNVARHIGASLEINDVLDIIVRELWQLVQYHGCGVFLLHDKVLTLAAYSGPLGSEGLVESQTTLDDSPLLKEVVTTRSPLIVPDMLAHTPLTLRWHETAGSLQRRLLQRSRAWMGIPMINQGQVMGVLQIDRAQPGYFTEQHSDLVLNLASQAAVAVVNARLYSQAQGTAAIEERQRLARELHDSVAQTFYSIALAAHSAKAQLRRNPDTAEQRLAHIVGLAEAGLTEMKALIFDLQMEGLRRDGLVQALRRHVDALTVRNDIRVHAELDGEPSADLGSKEAIYGIAREALQNVVRHANATDLYLKLSHSNDALSVEVRDNGTGFEADTAGEGTMGLRSMRERASAAGGSVEISSSPGEGAIVRAQVPLTYAPLTAKRG
ncbi:MAG: GAF domain-containing protein [Nitrososphaerales archaeon]